MKQKQRETVAMCLSFSSLHSLKKQRGTPFSLPSRLLGLLFLGLLVTGGCGGGSNDPPPASISLLVNGGITVEESENPLVQVEIQLDAAAREDIQVQLEFAGTAARNQDYEVSGDSFLIQRDERSATAEIDVYRDFEAEGDETIEIGISSFTGHAETGESSSITLTLLDGESTAINKELPAGDQTEALLLPFVYQATADAFVMSVIALVPPDASAPVRLQAEWSTQLDFETDVHLIGSYEVEHPDASLDFPIPNIRHFSLPLEILEPQGSYYLRAYLGDAPQTDMDGQFRNLILLGFATDSDGQVKARCDSPMRTPAAGGGDPLFPEQWHLQNTGQTAFSESAGIEGADMRMATTIDEGRNGAGVKLAVVDSGLELCHPDLAANTLAGGSFNFAFPGRPGTSPTDPFNIGILGDHGTSVAGIAAAAANNGFGGRGVAPEVTLVAFNPVEAGSNNPQNPISAIQNASLMSLGASEADPDSASVDIFNMSYGSAVPQENSQEEEIRLFKMGTEELRSGNGALYVKAAGNDFDACNQDHPFNRELGCISSNSDPNHNLPWLIVVGGFNAVDEKYSHSSAGANLWVVGPAGEDGREAPAMITTDQAGTKSGYDQLRSFGLTSDHPLNQDGDYFSAFGGTSSATPAVSGAIAILLGVNPQLNWRDVKHILATSARTIDPDIGQVRAAFNGTPYVAQSAWQTNAAGYDFHNWYGFGAVDVDAAVAMASEYLPNSLGAFVESEWFDADASMETSASIPDADGAGASAVLQVDSLPEYANIEAVVLEINVEHTNALDLGVSLRSPAGTSSVVNPPLNQVLQGSRGLHSWHLLSNAFYGEHPNGEWTLKVVDIAPEDTGSLTHWRLRFYYGEHPPQ